MCGKENMKRNDGCLCEIYNQVEVYGEHYADLGIEEIENKMQTNRSYCYDGEKTKKINELIEKEKAEIKRGQERLHKAENISKEAVISGINISVDEAYDDIIE
jgi:hypothetical protein